MNTKIIWLTWLTALTAVSIATFFLSLGAGSADISLFDAFKLFNMKIRGVLPATPEAAIIFNIRIPRLITAFLVGGALSLAGLIFQGMFRNPLVEPYTLGVSGGAALAVSIGIICGISWHYGLPVLGITGALISIFFVYVIGSKWRGVAMTPLLLTGVMFSFISSALIMLIMSISRAEEVHGIIFWIMGSLEETRPLFLKLVSVIIPFGLILSFFKAWDLNALAAGEEEAAHLGINIKKTKKQLFLLSSFLTGISVSVSGIIGFVGLVVPHAMRMFVGTDHRILIPTSFLCGGIFLTLCDTIARTVIAPVELPVGVITGIIGGGIFIYLLTKKSSSA